MVNRLTTKEMVIQIKIFTMAFIRYLLDQDQVTVMATWSFIVSFIAYITLLIYNVIFLIMWLRKNND